MHLEQKGRCDMEGEKNTLQAEKKVNLLLIIKQGEGEKKHSHKENINQTH